jgi:hypothetical protein
MVVGYDSAPKPHSLGIMGRKIPSLVKPFLANGLQMGRDLVQIPQLKM